MTVDVFLVTEDGRKALLLSWQTQQPLPVGSRYVVEVVEDRPPAASPLQVLQG